jgi:hypothetical protein
MLAKPKATGKILGRTNERGAALITMLLVSLLMLAAGGTLILTTSMSATNSLDATSETQAYYAAEAGNQAVLDVLRGNVGPNPVFVADPVGGVASGNKISFRKAVTISSSNVSTDLDFPHLSRWLTYNTDYVPSRVVLSSAYTPMTGMAFSSLIRDPDTSAIVTFSTSGIFTNYSSDISHTFSSGPDRATLRYDPQTSTTIDTTGASTFGKFTIISVDHSGFTLSDEPFKLTINQTAPWAATYTIDCTLSGNITSTTSFVNIAFPTLTNNLLGVVYTRATVSIASNGTTSIPVAITAPEPNRLVVNTTGYGPRNARKQMRMILSRFAFELSAPSAITIRSADDNSVLTFNAGNSAKYLYSGNDHAAGGTNLSAFAVTGAADKTYLDSLALSAGQVMGNPSGVLKIDIADLPTWLQTADAARAFLTELRTTAQNESRYFTTATPPPDFGTITKPILTFVDGNVDLPPGGGAGMLVVTGTLTLNGSSDYKGVILVLGGGQLIRDGGGNGDSWGAMLVARFGNTGNFLAPSFASSGSGTSLIQYDSEWVRNGLASTGPRVIAIGEF